MNESHFSRWEELRKIFSWRISCFLRDVKLFKMSLFVLVITVSLNKNTNLQISNVFWILSIFLPLIFSQSFVFFPYFFHWFSRLFPFYHNTTCFEAMVKQVRFRPVGREGKRAYVLPRSLSRTTDPSPVTVSHSPRVFSPLLAFLFIILVL